jgi:hypothetical protein
LLGRSGDRHGLRADAKDLAAMAEYIKSLPPVDGPMPPKRKESSG